MSSRRDAWLGNASAMLSLFGSDIRPISKSKKQAEIFQNHPAFMYKLFGVEHLPNRGVMVYQDVISGELRELKAYGQGITPYSVTKLVTFAKIRPEYPELARRQEIKNPKVWSAVYENFDMLKDKARIITGGGHQDQGLVYDKRYASLVFRLHLDTLRKGFTVSETPHKFSIPGIKLGLVYRYINVELFDGVTIRLRMDMAKDGSYLPWIKMYEADFYILNSVGGYGFIATMNELIRNITKTF